MTDNFIVFCCKLKLNFWLNAFFKINKNNLYLIFRQKPKKVPVELPQMTVPHVSMEYDQHCRNAVVIRYNNGEEYSLIFHFNGDDAFRTVRGIV